MRNDNFISDREEVIMKLTIMHDPNTIIVK